MLGFLFFEAVLHQNHVPINICVTSIWRFINLYLAINDSSNCRAVQILQSGDIGLPIPIVNNFCDLSSASGNNYSLRISNRVISKNLYLNNVDSLLTNWSIPQDKTILELMKNMNTISHYELNKCYSNFHCGIQGELIYEDVRYDYNLNSGGWLQLKNAKAKAITQSQSNETFDAN